MVSSRAGTPYGSPLSDRAVDNVSSSQPFRRTKVLSRPGSVWGKEHWMSGTYWKEMPSFFSAALDDGNDPGPAAAGICNCGLMVCTGCDVAGTGSAAFGGESRGAIRRVT